MDNQSAPTSLEEMLSISNTRATFHNQVRIAGHKFRTSCILSFQGGRFLITQEFIGHLYYKTQTGTDKAIVLDESGIPVLIEDITEFLDLASSRYYEALNEYYEEYTRLRATRRVDVFVEATE